MFEAMDMMPPYAQSLGERMIGLWRSGVRLVARMAIAFGLSTAAGIGLGAAIADNAFVQIGVTVLAAAGFWIPFLFLVIGVERFFDRRRAARIERAAAARTSSGPSISSSNGTREGWDRLLALAPAHRERLTVLRRSLEKSRHSLGAADLDPEAHDLCVLIDRRLPELIHRELDALPPDDRHRGHQIDELVNLIEQFARHCGRKGAGGADAGHEAAILRRRFESHLTGF